MGRLEILTGHERRRVWSDAQKLDILSDVATSGQSVVDVARRHDIVPQQIYAGASSLTPGGFLRKRDRQPLSFPSGWFL